MSKDYEDLIDEAYQHMRKLQQVFIVVDGQIEQTLLTQTIIDGYAYFPTLLEATNFALKGLQLQIDDLTKKLKNETRR